MTVAQLVTPPSVTDEIKASIVQELTDLLEQAQRGEFSTMVVMFKRANGRWGHYESGTIDFCDAIGRLEIVKHEWVAEFTSQRHD